MVSLEAMAVGSTWKKKVLREAMPKGLAAEVGLKTGMRTCADAVSAPIS